MNWEFPHDRASKRRYLLDAVEAVRPVVLAGVAEAEAEFTLPDATFEALYDAGLFWLKLPEVLGGAEADPLVQIEVIEALAQVDASPAWSVMIGSQSDRATGRLAVRRCSRDRVRWRSGTGRRWIVDALGDGPTGARWISGQRAVGVRQWDQALRLGQRHGPVRGRAPRRAGLVAAGRRANR